MREDFLSAIKKEDIIIKTLNDNSSIYVPSNQLPVHISNNHGDVYLKEAFKELKNQHGSGFLVKGPGLEKFIETYMDEYVDFLYRFKINEMTPVYSMVDMGYIKSLDMSNISPKVPYSDAMPPMSSFENVWYQTLEYIRMGFSGLSGDRSPSTQSEWKRSIEKSSREFPLVNK